MAASICLGQPAIGHPAIWSHLVFTINIVRKTIFSSSIKSLRTTIYGRKDSMFVIVLSDLFGLGFGAESSGSFINFFSFAAQLFGTYPSASAVHFSSRVSDFPAWYRRVISVVINSARLSNNHGNATMARRKCSKVLRRRAFEPSHHNNAFSRLYLQSAPCRPCNSATYEAFRNFSADDMKQKQHGREKYFQHIKTQSSFGSRQIERVKADQTSNKIRDFHGTHCRVQTKTPSSNQLPRHLSEEQPASYCRHQPKSRAGLPAGMRRWRPSTCLTSSLHGKPTWKIFHRQKSASTPFGSSAITLSPQLSTVISDLLRRRHVVRSSVLSSTKPRTTVQHTEGFAVWLFRRYPRFFASTGHLRIFRKAGLSHVSRYLVQTDSHRFQRLFRLRLTWA